MQTGPYTALQCPDCSRLFVVSPPLQEKRRWCSPHVSAMSPHVHCRALPLRVDRPDVISAFLLGGLEAVNVLTDQAQDDRKENET